MVYLLRVTFLGMVLAGAAGTSIAWNDGMAWGLQAEGGGPLVPNPLVTTEHQTTQAPHCARCRLHPKRGGRFC